MAARPQVDKMATDQNRSAKRQLFGSDAGQDNNSQDARDKKAKEEAHNVRLD